MPSCPLFITRIVRGAAVVITALVVMTAPLPVSTNENGFAIMTAHAATQSGWAGDIPLMDGLQIEPELGFAFDSPSGRIVMIFASTALSDVEIRQFYSETLKNLGWKIQGDSWVRAAESLSISQVQTANGMLWRIMLRPK